jgi:hypothetical protein
MHNFMNQASGGNTSQLPAGLLEQLGSMAGVDAKGGNFM